MGDDRFQIRGIDRIDKDRVIVDFSDGTQMTFTTEELIAVAPNRVPSDVQDEDLG
jgi:hypothetical protein